VKGNGAHSHKKFEKLPQMFPLRVPKCVLFFVSPVQHSLSATYPASISTIFKTKDVNRCPHAYTGEKFFKFKHRIFQAPNASTHKHTQPFYGFLDFVRDNLDEPVPEETFTHSHLLWSF